MSSITPALPKGTLILITGANGYIASHIVNQLLKLGYRVRGTVRNEKPWLNKLFSKYGEGTFETVIVPEITIDGAFDEAVKGVDGIMHVASDLSISPEAERVIAIARNGTLSVLKSAAKTPSVSRVVVTSSSTACNLPKSLEPTVSITQDTWNDEAVALTQKLDTVPDAFLKGYIVYSASKTLAEKTAFDFVKEQKPGFVLNTVLPSTTLGTNLDPENIGGSTGSFIRNIYTKKDFDTWRFMEPQYHINVVDCARLHIVGLLNPTLASQRLFAYEKPYTQSQIHSILTRMKPDFAWPAPSEADPAGDRSDVPGAARAEALVTEFFGVEGFRSLEESLEEIFDGVF